MPKYIVNMMIKVPMFRDFEVEAEDDAAARAAARMQCEAANTDPAAVEDWDEEWGSREEPEVNEITKLGDDNDVKF